MDRVVRDIDLDYVRCFRDLLESYIEAGGFMARRIGEAFKLYYEAIKDNYTKFLSFPADIIATGVRGVIRTLFRKKWVDVVITTSGTLDHDLARSYKNYYHGDFHMDDRMLKAEKKHRLGNIIIPYENYGLIIEEKMKEFLNLIYNKGYREISTHELSWLLGEYINDENSILYWAYKNKIPVIIPGPYDGAVGSQIWMFQQFHRDFKLDLFKDEKLLCDIVYDSKKTFALILGGGISKHHLLWWNQFRGGLDIAIQITSGIEYDGSLTGARLTEAITWGKVRPEGHEVTIWGEITVILPLIVKGLTEVI